MPGTGLTIEDADLLIDLLGARTMGWADPSAGADGYVAVEEIKRSLVHSAAAISRRISDLEKYGYVEIRKALAGKRTGEKVDKRKVAIRITDRGIAKIRPVYEKHCRVCEDMLRGISLEDRRTLLRINEALIDTVR